MKISIGNKKEKNKLLEIIFLFIGIPIILFFQISIYIKISCFLFGIIYIIWLSVINKNNNEKVTKEEKNIKIWNVIGIRFFIIVVSTTLVLFFTDRVSLFNVITNKPILWLKFSGIYILVSVIPQELLYRTFFINRYKNLFSNEALFILVNGLLFSFAHIWFRSWVVFGFTFIGGLLFAKTYITKKSIWVVIVEHSLYGVWLYTVGYGKLFMFPV